MNAWDVPLSILDEDDGMCDFFEEPHEIPQLLVKETYVISGSPGGQTILDERITGGAENKNRGCKRVLASEVIWGYVSSSQNNQKAAPLLQ